MNTRMHIHVIMFFSLSVVLATNAFAQNEEEKPKTFVSRQSIGTTTPIPLSQILSGNANGYSSGASVTPYIPTGGVGYNMNMSTADVMQYRARRDAMAQAQSDLVFDDMNQSYLDKEYQQAFQKYQAQFREDNGDGASGGYGSNPISSKDVKVKYNKYKKNKLFVTPRRVFKAY